MNEVIPAMFHTASIWLTLALAVQRWGSGAQLKGLKNWRQKSSVPKFEWRKCAVRMWFQIKVWKHIQDTFCYVRNSLQRRVP
jgi:hypothetical protein